MRGLGECLSTKVRILSYPPSSLIRPPCLPTPRKLGVGFDALLPKLGGNKRLVALLGYAALLVQQGQDTH
jgi:hypothetical protein